jgi:nucleotide-binding universal stress UspA family protein
MNILIAVDGSDYTQRMLRYVREHFSKPQATHALTVLTVVPSLLPRAAAVMTKETVDAYYRDEAEAVLGPIRASLASDALKAEFVSLVGHPAEAIAQVAQQGQHDLLIMGSHGHGSLGGLVMGSVAAKVLSHCQVPLLLVR